MPTHTVRSYDQDLQSLEDMLTNMTQLVMNQIKLAMLALRSQDHTQANTVIEGDAPIDTLEEKIDQFAIRLIALRQPLAQDLRVVVTALKIASHLERTADYATNIARRVLHLPHLSKIFQPQLDQLDEMATHVTEMIEKIIDAYKNRDATLATEVWHQDRKVDQIYTHLFQTILNLIVARPQDLGIYMDLLLISKHLERSGDQATNLAEMVYYLVTGQVFPDDPKASADA